MSDERSDRIKHLDGWLEHLIKTANDLEMGGALGGLLAARQLLHYIEHGAPELPNPSGEVTEGGRPDVVFVVSGDGVMTGDEAAAALRKRAEGYVAKDVEIPRPKKGE